MHTVRFCMLFMRTATVHTMTKIARIMTGGWPHLVKLSRTYKLIVIMAMMVRVVVLGGGVAEDADG